MGDLLGNQSSALKAVVACVDVNVELVTPSLALDEAWAWVGAGAIGDVPRPMVRVAAGVVGAMVGAEDAASFLSSCFSHFIDVLVMQWSRVCRMPRT